ncbi:ComF family protein [Paeniclostridium hominis]|nr:ComF family protein [Paeniclostridium hominis]
MVFKFKYNDKTFMAKYIANIIKDKLESENIKYDYILYVPLHKNRERKRGFNQSKLIAKYLGCMTNIEVLNCIKRNKNTSRLFKLKNEERIKELKNAFTVNDKIGICKNKNILLVDDIFTTGSTVNEISKILQCKEVNNIYVCTLLTKINSY